MTKKASILKSDVKTEQKKHKCSSSLPSIIIFSLVFSLFFSSVGIYGLVTYYPELLPTNTTENTKIIKEDTGDRIVNDVIENEEETIEAVQKVAPAVVSIIVTKDLSEIYDPNMNFFFNDPFLELNFPESFILPEEDEEKEDETFPRRREDDRACF